MRKLGLQVVLADELVAGFDAFDGIGLQAFRPVAQVAVDGDPFRRIGDADGAVLAVARTRPRSIIAATRPTSVRKMNHEARESFMGDGS